MEVSRALHKANISFWDGQNKEVIEEVPTLWNFINFEVDENELIKAIEIERFRKITNDFKVNWGSALEFYRQHKKTLETDNDKQKTFCRLFNIIDYKRFKQDLKETYPDIFYDETIRRQLLEEQDHKCSLCRRDIFFCEPHLHHINYNKEDCSLNNLVFLCSRCHGKTNSKRDFWKNVLRERKLERKEIQTKDIQE